MRIEIFPTKKYTLLVWFGGIIIFIPTCKSIEGEIGNMGFF